MTLMQDQLRCKLKSALSENFPISEQPLLLDSS